MDTLMDKLAQKLNAQEMIRANGEAETEQMNFLKTQVSEYQGCLDKLAQVCNELGNLETRLGNLSLPDNKAVSDETVSEIKKQLETLSQSTDSQLKDLTESTGRQIKDMQEGLLEKVNSDENLHKEGVRIYKNIQASMINELEPIEESIRENDRKLNKRISGIKAIAIVALCFSGVTLFGVIYLILVSLHIL
jgi:hypothetical protein